MTNFELSDGQAVLIFYPHGRGHEDTATFDVVTSNLDTHSPSRMPPDECREGYRICSNLGRAAAAELRDALSVWLAQPAGRKRKASR